MYSIRLVALAALVSCGLGACSTIPSSSVMPVARAMPAPISYLDFCARSPAECGLDAGGETSKAVREQVLYQRYWGEMFKAQSGGPDPAAPAELQRVALDAALWRLMSDTNLRVNAKVRGASDEALYGRANVWTLPASRDGAEFGDCKDIALQKRHDLLAAGVPSAAMAIALVRTPGGRSHAVLTVATERGDFVLDSLTPWVSPWKDLDYVWVERQDPQDPTRWLALDHAPQQVGRLQAPAGDGGAARSGG